VTDIASLGVEVDTREADRGARDLDALTSSAQRAQRQADSLRDSTERFGRAGALRTKRTRSLVVPPPPSVSGLPLQNPSFVQNSPSPALSRPEQSRKFELCLHPHPLLRPTSLRLRL
jgi:hypothetical protein